MNRPASISLLLLTSLGAGIASSPTCRIAITHTIHHHSSATLQSWRDWNHLHPKQAQRLDMERRSKSIADTLAALKLACDDIQPTLPQLTDLIPSQPSLDVPIEFASQPVGQPSMDDTAATSGSNVEIAAETIATDNPGWHGGSAGWGPILLGGGSAPPTTPPVAPIPEPATISLLILGALIMWHVTLQRRRIER